MEIPAFQPSDFPSVFIGLIMLTVLVSGCAKHRLETYQELRDTKIQRPAYYYTEVEKKITNTESEPIIEPDPFLSEVEAKVLKYQKQWQAQLESETPMPNLFYDLSTDTEQFATPANIQNTFGAEASTGLSVRLIDSIFEVAQLNGSFGYQFSFLRPKVSVPARPDVDVLSLNRHSITFRLELLGL